MSDLLRHHRLYTCQAPLSMGFSRQEYWSGLPFPSPGGLPAPRIKPASLALADRLFTTEPLGKPPLLHLGINILGFVGHILSLLHILLKKKYKKLFIFWVVQQTGFITVLACGSYFIYSCFVSFSFVAF